MKPVTCLAAGVFALVATAHLVRLLLGWDVFVAGVSIPLWVSGVGVIVPGGLAVMLMRESRAGR